MAVLLASVLGFVLVTTRWKSVNQKASFHTSEKETDFYLLQAESRVGFATASLGTGMLPHLYMRLLTVPSVHPLTTS